MTRVGEFELAARIVPQSQPHTGPSKAWSRRGLGVLETFSGATLITASLCEIDANVP